MCLAAAMGILGAAVGVLLATAPAAAATTHAVTISNYAFAPAALTVHVGDTITWTNHDEAPHNIVSTSAPTTIDGPIMNKGGSWSYTFTKAGTYAYICGVHPDMKASVTVLAAPPPPTSRPALTSSQPSIAANHPAAHHVAPSKPAVASSSRPASKAATKPSASSAAAAAAASTSPPAASTQVLAQTGTVSTARIKPLLLVAGAIAVLTVFCLLALAARPSDS